MLEVFQASKGYRFGVETLLLCGFTRPGGSRMVDLGTGSGIIPLVLTRFGKVDQAKGVEIQPDLADRARRSVEHNGLGSRIEIVESDLRDLGGVLPPGRCDLVTANPPFRTARSGKVCKEKEKAIAKQEILCTLSDVVDAAARLLKPRGSFVVVLPPQRLGDLFASMENNRLKPARLRMVHGRIELAAKHCLVEAVRGGRNMLVAERPLIVYDKTKKYTKEVKEMLYPSGGQDPD